MEQRIIIITPDARIETMSYREYADLKKAVGGYYEICASLELPVLSLLADGRDKLPVDVFCNEEFHLQEHKFSKVNAIATLITGQEIRGNAAVAVRVMDENGFDTRGFYYEEEEMDNGELEEAICECWTAEDTLLRFIKANEAVIQILHEKFDITEGERIGKQ